MATTDEVTIEELFSDGVAAADEEAYDPIDEASEWIVSTLFGALTLVEFLLLAAHRFRVKRRG
jgi:hypothetical protein